MGGLDDDEDPVEKDGMGQPVYEVEPAHLELLTRLGFSYEILPERKRKAESRQHGKAD